MSGLSLSSVSRLKATWERVEPKYRKRLAEIEGSISPLNNFKGYRQLLDSPSLEPPFLPIVSLFLKDLLFLNDGNPKRLESGLLNVGKLWSVQQAIDTFMSFQAVAYIPPLHLPLAQMDVVEYGRSLRALKSESLYKYSCLCEAPNGDEDSVRLREKWMQESSRDV